MPTGNAYFFLRLKNVHMWDGLGIITSFVGTLMLGIKWNQCFLHSTGTSFSGSTIQPTILTAEHQTEMMATSKDSDGADDLGLTLTTSEIL